MKRMARRARLTPAVWAMVFFSALLTACSAYKVQAPYDAFVNGGYRLKTLIKSLASSPEFFRAPAPAPAVTKTASNN